MKGTVLVAKKDGDVELLRKERAFTETITNLERKNKALDSEAQQWRKDKAKMTTQLKNLSDIIEQLKAAPPGSAPAKAAATPRSAAAAASAPADSGDTKQLKDQLAAIMAEKEALTKENEYMKSELSQFDESFFNEVEVIMHAHMIDICI